MANLKEGSRGIDIIRLQLLLNSTIKPSPRLKPDGAFGSHTTKAVISFQNSVRLRSDGIVGPKTWNALGQASNSASANTGDIVTSPWMGIARAELGVHEYSTVGKHNKRILEYHASTTLGAKTDEVPWCSSFVNWVMVQAGYRGTNNALAMSWLEWGRESPTPLRGAITVIKRKGQEHDKATGTRTGYHVGFMESKSTTHVRLLGGNQGDRVKYSNFNLKSFDVKGYQLPVQRANPYPPASLYIA